MIKPIGRIDIFKKICVFLFFLFLSRSLYLFVFFYQSNDLKNLSDQQYSKIDQDAYSRGLIVDRRGETLAISVNKPSLAINPRVFRPSQKEKKKISNLLDLSEMKISELRKQKNYFAWLKRGISFEVADQIKGLHLNGLHIILEPHRFYPQMRLASNLLGYVGLDHIGLLGMEYFFENFLKPSLNSFSQEKDAKGRTVLIQEQEMGVESSGKNIHLTIDLVIQEIAEESLRVGVERAHGKAGFAIVADPHSGRILALANYPNFDPNDHEHFSQEKTKNIAFSMLYEAGSVIKPFVVALALDRGLIRQDQVHYCEKNGVLAIDSKNVIHDEHPKEFLTTEEILIHSSNICTYKVASVLGKDNLFNGLKNFGFASSLKNPYLSGFLSGRIENWQNWSNIRFSNVAFGQGFSVSGLEVVSAYNVIANGGFYFSPKIIEKITTGDGQIFYQSLFSPHHRVVSGKTAKDLRESLTKVVTQGTGRNAVIPGFSSAGKTGTSQKFDNILKKYSDHARIASFVGFAPALDPHLTIYVVIDEPGLKPYFGGTWAAPVFSEIGEKTLRYLNVPSDLTLSQGLTQRPAKLTTDDTSVLGL